MTGLILVAMGIAVTLGIATITGLWKLSASLATLAESLEGMVNRFIEVNRRISRVEQHQDSHDAWHMNRIRTGKDTPSA